MRPASKPRPSEAAIIRKLQLRRRTRASSSAPTRARWTMAGVRHPIDVNDEHRDRFESALPPARLLARGQVASCLLPNKAGTRHRRRHHRRLRRRRVPVQSRRSDHQKKHSLKFCHHGREGARIVSFLGFTGMKAASCFGK